MVPGGSWPCSHSSIPIKETPDVERLSGRRHPRWTGGNRTGRIDHRPVPRSTGSAPWASEHVFGIPGDYVLTLYKLIEESPIKLVGMTREDNAGFAADAYARIHGLGCVCVTYCVGGLSTCNSIAGAYAEKSPVIVLAARRGSRSGHGTRCCTTR